MTNNVFAEAAKYLPGRWTKGAYEDDLGNLCLLGHLGRANHILNENASNDERIASWVEVLDHGINVLAEFTNGEFDVIPDFNDNENTTEADALAFLEKAAVRWDEQANLTD